jgi:hypothetical protein
LYGGVRAHLCVACINEFEGIVLAHPVYERMERHTAQGAYYQSLAEAGQPVAEGLWLEHGREHKAIINAIRPLSLEFVKPLPVEADADA